MVFNTVFDCLMSTTLDSTFYHILKAFVKNISNSDAQYISTLLAKKAQEYFQPLEPIPESKPARFSGITEEPALPKATMLSGFRSSSSAPTTTQTTSPPVKRSLSESQMLPPKRSAVSPTTVIQTMDAGTIEPSSFQNQYGVTFMDDTVVFKAPEKR